jgi:hypothetical protein
VPVIPAAALKNHSKTLMAPPIYTSRDEFHMSSSFKKKFGVSPGRMGKTGQVLLNTPPVPLSPGSFPR